MDSVLDITERKRAEELNRQQEEKLQATSRLVTMGEMASTLAHELNQPLAAISSYNTDCLNKLTSGNFTPAELHGAMEKLGLQAQRAGKIIRRVHDFVRKSEPKLAECDLAEVIDDAIGFIEAFSKSLFAMVVGRYLEAHHSAPVRRAELVQRQGDGPYHNGTVVIVEKPAERLFVGQPVFVIAGSREARWGRIQSLRIDDGSVQVVEANAIALQGIGVALDFRCPKGATLVALSADDDVVWNPPVIAAPAPAA